MKVIKYRYLSAEVNHGTDEQPDIQPVIVGKTIPYSEENLVHAREEAVGGEVTVEDVPDPVTEPTKLDTIEAQVTYTAMMTDTLLEEV